MLDLLNEYDCNLDSKGRFMFPAKWRKQLEDVLHSGLVVTRDRQANCLIVYPKPQWDRMYKNIELLAETSRRHREFLRLFIAGATHVELDATGRFLLPGKLMGFIEVDSKKDKEITVVGMVKTIEIWKKGKNEDATNVTDDYYNTLEDEANDYIARMKTGGNKAE